ncbi:hypothetical protein K435DRAFT_563752, partial [Dendrothele bispora CBS 962.96]
IRESLIRSCEGRLSRWPDLLPLAIFADRITIRRQTGFSPFYILHGLHPLLSFDLTEASFLVDGWSDHMTDEDLITLRIKQIESQHQDVQLAAETLRVNRFKTKAQFESHAKRLLTDHYEKDQLVLVKNSWIAHDLGRKSKPRWLGPYAIVRRTKGGSYIIRELNGNVSRQGIAATRLMPY